MCIAFWLLVRCSIVGVFNVMNELLMQGLVYKALLSQTVCVDQ